MHACVCVCGCLVVFCWGCFWVRGTRLARGLHALLCGVWVGCPCFAGGMLSGFGAVRPGAWFLLILGPLFAAVYCCCGCCGGGGFGFGGCGWVGCELYSGREHLCFVCFVVVCFFERSVDALASGADEGRGGLR